MFAVFGMTPILARARATKIAKGDTLEDVKADIVKKAAHIMDSGRAAQLSDVYGVYESAEQYADIAVKSGGVRITIFKRVADGEPQYDKKKKCEVQRYKWESVKAVSAKSAA